MPPEPQPKATSLAGQPSWMAPVQPVVPDHELIRRIGGGSYGDVWLARNVVGTWRAVKVVFRDRFTDARPYDREFSGMQKFEPLSRSNEGFVDILQIGRNDEAGYFYYVMELADQAGPGAKVVDPLAHPSGTLSPSGGEGRGEGAAAPLDPASYVPLTLSKALLQRGRLPVNECLELGLTLNLGLAHLHRAGLIHRDIKPSNIIFVGGVPKLADIGLVVETSEARSYVGTEGFIPPEGPTSPQADLYSLGKVLYEAGMGKDRKDFPEPFTQIAEAADSEQLLEFNAILLKACAANVAERYQSAEDMNADLALLQSGGSVRQQRKLAGQLRFVQRAGVIASVIAALVAAGWFWQARQTRIVRGLADANSVLAKEKSRLADEKTKLADENRERVVRLDVANGVRILDEGDDAGSLLWFAQALPLVTNNPAEEEIHRIRIQQVMDRTPHLENVLGESGPVMTSALSPDGKLFALAADLPSRLRVRKVQSGEVVWGPKQLEGAAFSLRFTRDGRRLLVSSSSFMGVGIDSFVAVLDAQTGQDLLPALRQIPGIAPNTACSAFSPDDRWLAIALSNHVIRVLDARDGRPVAELTGHTKDILLFSFSADGSLLASGSEDQTVRLWRLPSGESVGEPLRHNRGIRHAALSDDGARLLTAASTNPKGSADKGFGIQAWDVQKGIRIGEVLMETNPVFFLTFCPGDGDRFIVGPDRFEAELRDFSTMKLLFPPIKMKSVARCWDFSADGKRVAIGSDGARAYVWSLETGESLHPPFPHNGWVNSVHFSPEGSRLLTASDDGTAKVWALRQDAETARLSLSANHIGGPTQKHRPRGRTPGPIPVMLADQQLHLIDPERLTELDVLPAQETNATFLHYTAGHSGRCWTLAESSDGATPRITVTLWLREGQGWRRQALPHPTNAVHSAFNTDDSLLFTYSLDSNVRVWRTSDGGLERSIAVPQSLWCPPARVLQEAFRPDGSALLFGHGSSQKDIHLQLFELATGQLVGKPFAATKLRLYDANRMRFSPDGMRLASVGDDQTGTIIDFQTGELAAPQFKHGGGLTDLDWSPDGKRLITTGLSHEIKLWDAATGEMLLSPMPLSSAVMVARWSADGRFIVGRSKDRFVRVWDAATTEAVTPLLRHSGYIEWVCITPGNRLITASGTNLLRSWNLKPTALAPDVIADYARLVAGRRLGAGGTLLPLKPDELERLHRSLRSRAPQLFETSK